jgi:hypothetical protein
VKNKTITALLFTSFLILTLPTALAQDWNFSPDWLLSYDGDLAVILYTPANNSIITTLACNFTYAPITTNDTFYAASLYIDGAPVAYNETAIENATSNTISYTFSGPGVYVWNVQVWNSTHGVFADGNYTLIVNASPTASPSPTPKPASENTDFMLITIFSFGFFLLGTREGIGQTGDIDFARALIYYFASLLCSILCVGLYLSMSTGFSLAFWFIPFFFIILSFIMIIFTGWKAWLHRKEVTPSRNRRYYANEDF